MKKFVYVTVNSSIFEARASSQILKDVYSAFISLVYKLVRTRLTGGVWRPREEATGITLSGHIDLLEVVGK